MTSRAYCFTLNNYTEDDIALLSVINEKIRFICWGQEIAPETGTPHLQGYVEFKTPLRIAGIKKLNVSFARMHLEVRRGTRDEAKAYCAKGDQSKEEFETTGTNGPNYGLNVAYFEFGNWEAGGSGSRNDLGVIRNLAITEGMRGVALTGNMQQIKVAEAFLKYHEEPRDWLTEVFWFWGPSGSGKSRAARELFANADFFVKNDNSKWWDGYDGHEAVIIDDFRDSWWSLTEMLSLLDRYEKRVETKGGWRQFKPKQIVVTSIHPPSHMYRIADEDSRQLIRRVTRVDNFVTRFCHEVGGVILEPPSLENIQKVLGENRSLEVDNIANDNALLNIGVHEMPNVEDNIANDDVIILDI